MQKDSYQDWNVYRKYSGFLTLGECLRQIYRDVIPAVPLINETDVSWENLERCRRALDNWLKSAIFDEKVLKTQAMYQFLCTEANLTPPYVEVYWNMNSRQLANEPEDMDMQDMFENRNIEQMDMRDQEYDDDNEHVEHDDNQIGKTVWRIGGGTARSSSPSESMGSSMNRHQYDDMPGIEDDNDGGLDIQSLSAVEAEFLYDKDFQDAQPEDTGNGSQTASSVSTRKIKLEAFDIIKVIGKGSFGKVFLVRDKAKRSLHAMKVLKKDYIKKKNQVRVQCESRYLSLKYAYHRYPHPTLPFPRSG